MAFIAYADCSGDGRDPKVRAVCVAGFIATDVQWATLEDRWRDVLSRHEVSALHMKEFAHSAKGSEFATWKGEEQKRAAFMDELTTIINDCTTQSFSATVPTAVYRGYNSESLLTEDLGGPYVLASLWAISLLVGWHKAHKFSEPLMIVFEKGDNEQRELRAQMARLGEWNIDLVTEPIFQKKKWLDADGHTTRYCVPFQAADFICYEHAKVFTDFIATGKRTARQSLFRISYPPRDPEMWRIMSADTLRHFAKTLRVRMRYNRHLPGSEGTLPIKPLCYFDMDTPLVSYHSAQQRTRVESWSPPRSSRHSTRRRRKGQAS